MYYILIISISNFCKNLHIYLIQINVLKKFEGNIVQFYQKISVKNLVQ